MGHLLSTVNPEAAAAIQPRQVAAKDMPAVGSFVQYFARPGEGRRGGHEFGAMVTRVYDNGTIDGIAFYDADDFRNLERLPQRSEHHEFPAWDWREEAPTTIRADNVGLGQHIKDFQTHQNGFNQGTQDRIVAMEHRIDELAQALSRLYGEGLPRSVTEIDLKVKALELAKHEARMSDDWSKIADRRLDRMEEAINSFSDAIANLTKLASAKSSLSDVEARLDALEDKRSGVAPKPKTDEQKLRAVEAVMAGTKPKAKVKKRKKRRKAKRKDGTRAAPLPPAED